MAVEYVANTIAIHIEIALHELPKVVTDSIVRQPIAVRVPKGKSLQIVATSIELVQKGEHLRATLFVSRAIRLELIADRQDYVQRIAVSARTAFRGAVVDVVQRADLLPIQQGSVYFAGANLLESPLDELTPEG